MHPQTFNLKLEYPQKVRERAVSNSVWSNDTALPF